MNDSSKYSIAIRTIGKAGEKYKRLLKSIDSLKLRPQKVVVVLPEGFDLPQDRLGYEEFVFSEKSMIQQRIEALEYIDSEYTLFLDDDIQFDPFFVEKLLQVLDDGKYDCATGPLFAFFPETLAGKIAGTIIGNVVFRIYNRGYYVRILKNGGWSYRYLKTNENKCYPTESFAWTCFMIRTDVMRKIEMQEEKVWIEKNGYAWGDDRVMAYKMVLNGYKACIVSDALYIHNDAKTSTTGIQKDRKEYCSGFFCRVFWQRFIQDIETNQFKKIWNSFCYSYMSFMNNLYHLVKVLLSKGKYKTVYKAWRLGCIDAKIYVQSEEYKELPSVYTS